MPFSLGGSAYPSQTRLAASGSSGTSSTASWSRVSPSRRIGFLWWVLRVRAEGARARILDMPVAWPDQPHSKSSARLVNLSLLYLAGISQLRREIKTKSAGSAAAAARVQDWRRGE